MRSTQAAAQHSAQSARVLLAIANELCYSLQQALTSYIKHKRCAPVASTSGLLSASCARPACRRRHWCISMLTSAGTGTRQREQNGSQDATAAVDVTCDAAATSDSQRSSHTLTGVGDMFCRTVLQSSLLA